MEKMQRSFANIDHSCLVYCACTSWLGRIFDFIDKKRSQSPVRGSTPTST